MRTFTPEDFSGCGQYIVRVDAKQREQMKNGKAPHLCDPGYLSTIMYKVGYSHGNGFIHRPEDGNIIMKVSMADGHTSNGYFNQNGSTDPSNWTFVQWNGKQDFCDYLNHPDKEEYRMATQEEVVRVVLYQRSRWL